MEKGKILPLTLATLVISSILMALYAYENFSAGQKAYGFLFTLICVFLLGLVIYGVIRNKRISDDKKYES